MGAHVVRALHDAGYEVRALVRTPGARLECETVTGDLAHPGTLVPHLNGVRAVVHCAASYSFAPRDRAAMRRINVEGTAGLLEAARIAGVERAVVTSSSAALGPAHGERPATEDDWAHSDGHAGYHASKLEQERAAFAGRLRITTVVPTAPVGPGDHKPTPTGKMIVDFARGRMFAKPPLGGMNLVAVEDVARMHVAALELGADGERYIVGAENLTLDQIWERLAGVTGKPVPRWRVPYALALAIAYGDEARCRLRSNAVPFAPLEGVMMSRERMYADSSKAQRELGYAPQPVEDALERSVRWYRDNGYLN